MRSSTDNMTAHHDGRISLVDDSQLGPNDPTRHLGSGFSPFKNIYFILTYIY